MDPLSITDKKQTQEDRQKQQGLKRSGEIPEHIAVIMDGNGRWAREKGNMRVQGHKTGVDSVRDITEACAQLGVKYLTLYAFSTENWSRPSTEVNALMKLLVNTLRKEANKLNKNNIRLNSIGQVDRLPQVCQRELQEAMELTRENDRMQLNLALSYSGRWDVAEAVKKLTQKARNGEIDPEDVDEELISAHLSTADMPDPDLMIRTSGEYRISNFLLWQLAYSEFYITQTFWPDFRRDELYKAITSFQQRDRRFGKVQTDELEKVASNKSVLQKYREVVS